MKKNKKITLYTLFFLVSPVITNNVISKNFYDNKTLINKNNHFHTQKYNVNENEYSVSGKSIEYSSFSTSYTEVNGSVASNGIRADSSIAAKAPYELKISEVARFIVDNQGSIFNNAPNLSVDNVIDIGIEPIASTTAKITVIIPAYVSSDSLETINKGFNFNIVGLTNKDTFVNSNVQSNGINADASINQKSPYELKNTDIINFIVNNQNLIFHYIPNITSSYIKNVSISAISSTSVNITATIPSYSLGKYSENEFSFKIVGLANKDTSLKSNVELNGVDASLIGLSKYSPVDLKNNTSLILNNLRNGNHIQNIFNYPITTGWCGVEKMSFNNIVDSTTVNITVTLNWYYENGEYISGGKYKNFTFDIVNLVNKSTSIINDVSINGINAIGSLTFMAPYELNENDVKNFIVDNQSLIFINNPELTLSNVTSIAIEPLSSTSAKVTVTIPSYISGDSTNIENRTYSFVIKKLANKDTQVNSNGQWDASIFKINIPFDELNDSSLKEIILSNNEYKNILFSNFPNDISIDNVHINSISSNSINFNISVNKLYKNGSLTTNRQECTFSKLVIQSVNVNENIDNNNNDWWIWVVIGVSIIVIILFIIIMIILIKKKKNRKKNNKKQADIKNNGAPSKPLVNNKLSTSLPPQPDRRNINSTSLPPQPDRRNINSTSLPPQLDRRNINSTNARDQRGVNKQFINQPSQFVNKTSSNNMQKPNTNTSNNNNFKR